MGPYEEETGTVLIGRHWDFQTDSARQSWDCGSELQMWIKGVIHPQTKPLARIPWYPFSWGLQPPPSVSSVLEAEPGLGDGV